MNIDLSLLHSATVNNIDITGTYSLPKEYYENTDVLELNNIKVTGEIYQGVDEENLDILEDYVKCEIKCNVILKDSISLEPVEYPIFIEYDDILEKNCKKDENTLDIFQFLWENIVLEIPLRFTKVKDLSKFHGDGWKLISEEELVTSNNPFSDLLNDFKEE